METLYGNFLFHHRNYLFKFIHDISSLIQYFKFKTLIMLYKRALVKVFYKIWMLFLDLRL